MQFLESVCFLKKHSWGIRLDCLKIKTNADIKNDKILSCVTTAESSVLSQPKEAKKPLREENQLSNKYAE